MMKYFLIASIALHLFIIAFCSPELFSNGKSARANFSSKPSTERSIDKYSVTVISSGKKISPKKNFNRDNSTYRPKVLGPVLKNGNLNPTYPYLSRVRKETGKVAVNFKIQKDGTVSELKIKSSSGHLRLDKSALEYVSQLRYLNQGLEYPNQTIIIDFTLH